MNETTTVPAPPGESTSTLAKPASPTPPLQPAPLPVPPPLSDGIATADEWAAAGHHKVWLPSGKRIVIRIPDLFTLIQEDAVPEHLRAAALREIETGSAVGANPTGETEAAAAMTWELIKQAAELYEHVAFEMVVEPVIDIDAFRRLPAEDRDLLREIAMRQRGTDARGVRLGVEPLDRWATFRDAHRCPEGCAACEAAIGELSSLGAV